MTDIDKAIEEAWHQDALAAVMPFESWEQLPGETGAAYSAFCAFRDCGPERNIRKAVDAQFRKTESPNKNLDAVIAKKYRVWRNWCSAYRWRDRAADYDRYTEKLKQGEVRKTIEEQGRVHREITGKMLQVVNKKLDTMNPADLTQGTVTEWVSTAIRAEREAAGFTTPGGKSEAKQGEINFTPEFDGI
jgi:hypothetical protein